MTNPFTFPATTPNVGLPLLIAGQAQKEFFVNQALGIIDALTRGTVLASLSEPPGDADEGDCYRVTAPALQAWVGCEDHIAIRIGGDWHLIPPRDGMSLFDTAAGGRLFFQSGWQTAPAPVILSTGTVIDTEARSALEQLILALRDIGVIAQPAM